jgi:hypothetical protein
MSDARKPTTCAVIGAGLGGVAVCANMALVGYRMRLHDLAGARLTALRVLIQGGTGGSLVVRRELQRAGCGARVDVAEMDNYPYSLGWPEPTRMRMTIVKRFLQIAALPAARVDAVLERSSRSSVNWEERP